ncbi:TPA: DUF551 domain-containing protein [Klebsiella pneumoniae subsp. pneumoniae]|nr:DUF551 domain-containing protein [Klebsiella pneumoniae subsp. pneumoniae]
MTKSTITREQLLEIIETDHVQCGEASYLARMALAAMDSEPVAYIFKHPAGRLFWSLTDESNKGHDDAMPVYDSPQSPGSEPATVPGKWIPVSERMPEVGVKVLCFPVKDEPIHATFNGQLWLQDISWSGSDEPIDNVIPTSVTHWMPLPAAPQEVSDA